MRALELVGFDGPASLRLAERPEPSPGPGEVRVRFRAMALNHLDVFITRGLPKRELPAILGSDGAGVVDAVGEGVEAALHGLRVWVWEAAWHRPHGTAQEYALVPARHVVLLPDAASDDLGAALGIPFLTAHRCLTVTEGGPDRLGPGALTGRTVLVAGGAGAVTWLLALALERGARR